MLTPHGLQPICCLNPKEIFDNFVIWEVETEKLFFGHILPNLMVGVSKYCAHFIACSHSIVFSNKTFVEI